MADEFPDFELIPAGAEDLTADEELADLVDPTAAPEQLEDDSVPIGRTWFRDYDNEIYSGSPQVVTGTQAVAQIAQVALRTQRGSSIIFDEDFGMDHPESMIGQVDDPEIRAHYIRDVEETLLSCHDHITAVSNVVFRHDEDEEVGYLDVEAEVNGDETILLEGIALND